MLNKYIVTVQELHEKRYLVSNAVAPQQAQEWIENMEYGLSEMIENNIRDLDEENTRFITDGKNNIVDSLKDIKVEKVEDEDPSNINNTEPERGQDGLLYISPKIYKPNMGCTCGYDEEEVCGKDEDGNRAEMKLDCPDEKCECNR